MKLSITTLKQAMNTSSNWTTATNWLVEDYIPELSFGCLVAPSNSYKSFQAVDFACSIATGTNWNGKQVEQGTVVYFAGEGQNALNKRVAAWEQVTGINASQNLAVIGESIDLMDSECVGSIIELLKQEPVKFVIFDTLARCFSGEENSAKDISKFIAACDRIKQECDCSILVVHHTGKDTSKGARGSSALYAAMDYELVMERKANLEYTLKVAKQKDAEEQPTVICKLQVVVLGSDTKGKQVSSLAPETMTTVASKCGLAAPTTKAEQVAEKYLEALADGSKTRKELKELIPVEAESDRSKAIKLLEQKELVIIADAAKKQDQVFNLVK